LPIECTELSLSRKPPDKLHSRGPATEKLLLAKVLCLRDTKHVVYYTVSQKSSLL